MKRTLFEIGQDLRALDALLDESGGEITPETDAAYAAWFAELEQDQGQKLDGYIGLLMTWEGEEEVAAKVVEQFRAKMQAIGNRIKRHKDRMLLHLQATHHKEMKSASGWKVAAQNNSKAPLQVDPVDPTTLPIEFTKTITTTIIDTEKVRAALEAGEMLDFARILPRGQHLRIR